MMLHGVVQHLTGEDEVLLLPMSPAEILGQSKFSQMDKS